MRVLIILLLVSLNLIAQDKPEFQAFEIVIQSESEMNLAAWQAEIFYNKNKVKLTGVEGGEKPFSKPADYDARGLTGGKVVLAAFTLEKEQSAKEFIVARVHVLAPKGLIPSIILVVAADSKGKKIKAKALLRSIKKND